jgi:spore germination cell wall hydrolase CwlJ-like protein
MSLDINDFIKDYNDHMPICEMCFKYNIGNTTYFKILKQAKIKRRISSKTNRLFNVVVEKKDDNVKKVYHKPLNDPTITVVKKATDQKPPPKPPPKNTDSNISKALKDAKQCIDKVQSKYVKSGGDNDNNDHDNNDKSALIQAIQKSNSIRSKMLNKKNNI